MLAWRLCRKPYADLKGEGARLYGGRWNSPGRPLVYAASTAALAVLEIRVHLDLPPELLPDDYVLITIDLGVLAVEDGSGIPVDQRGFGDTWLRERRTTSLACAVRYRAGGQQCSGESRSPGSSLCPRRGTAPVRI